MGYNGFNFSIAIYCIGLYFSDTNFGCANGIIVYLLLFLDDEDDIIDEIETMNQQIDKKD